MGKVLIANLTLPYFKVRKDVGAQVGESSCQGYMAAPVKGREQRRCLGPRPLGPAPFPKGPVVLLARTPAVPCG